MRKQQVMMLRVDFKVELEEVVKGRIGAVYKAIQRWAKPCLHGKQTISFVLVTNETSTELHRRLDAPLKEMGCVEHFWTFLAPDVAVSDVGEDPFVHWLSRAWEKAREWNQAEDMRHSQSFRRAPKGRV